MNCSYCNTPLNPENTVCPGCGTPIQFAPQQQQQPAYGAPQQPVYAAPQQQPAYGAPQQPMYSAPQPQPVYAAQPQPAYGAPQQPLPETAQKKVANNIFTRYYGAYNLSSGRPMRGVFHILLAVVALLFLLFALDEIFCILINILTDLDYASEYYRKRIFSAQFYQFHFIRYLFDAGLFFFINTIWAAVDSK